MLFPRPMKLAVTHDNVVSFREGPQEVPVELADHWYLKNNGVKAYEPAAPLAPLFAPGEPEEEVEENKGGKGKSKK